MIKGDRIKIVKKMGVFDNIGEICEVTDIQEGGVICFKFGGCHLGCMSFDEYEKCFEKVEEPVKRTWSKWHLTEIRFTDINGEEKTCLCRYRNNGKKITLCRYDKGNREIVYELSWRSFEVYFKYRTKISENEGGSGISLPDRYSLTELYV